MATRSLFSTFRRFKCPNPLHLEAKSGASRPLSSSVCQVEEWGKEDDLRSRIFRLRLPKRSATNALEKWVAEGNKVTVSELRNLAKELRKLQRYKHALEISEWMVTHQEFKLSDSDYAVRIDLMTKVFGVDAAERYFDGLPQTAKTSETYTALLHSFAGAKLTERAERLFERMKKSDINFNALTYNEMMTLYISVGQLEKVPSVIEELKNKKVSPDLYTYNLWISACAAILEINNVRRILEEMSHDSNSDDGWLTYRQLTDIYITTGNLVNSGNSFLVEAEKRISQRELITYDFLIILFAGLGNKGKIDQIWKSLRITSQKMTSRNFICILSSYIILGQVTEAGEVLDEWKKSTSIDFDAHTCHRLLDAFAGAGLMDKSELLRDLMMKKNCYPAE